MADLLTYWTPYGLRTLDIDVWSDSGGLDHVETKSGDAKYEGDQLPKDDWLRGHGPTIDVCFER